MESIRLIFKQFNLKGTFESACRYGSGHINETFLIHTKEEGSPGYILQKINSNVFGDIPKMLGNIAQVTDYLNIHFPKSHNLQLFRSFEGNHYVIDRNLQYWSAYNFIDGVSYDVLINEKQALEGGKAWGSFLLQLIDFPSQKLHITLTGFHNLQLRLKQFYEALKTGNHQRVYKNIALIDFIRKHEYKMLDYQHKLFNSNIPLRITHNDTKFNNILFDTNDNFLCIIDLGTIMTGYIHYDFGDAIRTVCNTSTEDEDNLQKINFNLPFFKAFSQGYLMHTKQFLLEQEVEYLPLSPLFMTYMIGLRFFTDYLQNDQYFKIRYQEHNLQRAKVQFKLFNEMKKNSEVMEQIIKQIIHN